MSKPSTCVRIFFRLTRGTLVMVALGLAFLYAYRQYSLADFGSSFGYHATNAENKLAKMKEKFVPCAAFAKKEVLFLQAIVFPELMRYNALKDDIETESLRTLYVQFGSEYADFSIGVFQMKPTFAEQVESLAKQLLPHSVYDDLQLQYDLENEENIRRQRINRLMEENWQLVYLTAFACICDIIYQDKPFTSVKHKLQWYATVYNAGFNRSTEYLERKVSNANFYLAQQMPGKKFRYASIAAWYYDQPVKPERILRLPTRCNVLPF